MDFVFLLLLLLRMGQKMIVMGEGGTTRKSTHRKFREEEAMCVGAQALLLQLVKNADLKGQVLFSKNSH